MTIAGAIERIQELVIAAGTANSIKIRSAPDAPISSAAALPLSLCYISAANGGAEDASYNLTRYTITTQIHFNATSLRDVYTKANTLVPYLTRLLSGEPRLKNNVDTIIYPFDVVVAPSNFDGVPTIAAEFTVTVKVLDTHATST
jgi:hypothetical protein